MKKLLFVLFFFVIFQINSYASDLQVIVLDVGMGQSVLLVEDGHGFLVDTGHARYSPHVLSRMKYYGVDSLDYLILSICTQIMLGDIFNLEPLGLIFQFLIPVLCPRSFIPANRMRFLNFRGL